MKNKLFDYVIGNPPYQEDKTDVGRQAKPIYNIFFKTLIYLSLGGVLCD